MSPPALLCVDDRPELLQVHKTTLERLGCSVHIATTALAALAVLERTPITAVLLEHKCEGMNAEAVVFHIKQRFPPQPVILLSASSDMPGRILWLADEYGMRSDPPERVLQVVEQMRGRPNRRRTNNGCMSADTTWPPDVYTVACGGVVSSPVLNSWKEIAQYLGRGVRTAERWKKEMGLPVKRPRQHPHSPVIAMHLRD